MSRKRKKSRSPQVEEKDQVEMLEGSPLGDTRDSSSQKPLRFMFAPLEDDAEAVEVSPPGEEDAAASTAGRDAEPAEVGSDRREPPSTRHGGGTAQYLSDAKRLVATGRIEEAIGVYLRAVNEDPTSLKARNNLGVLYDELGQHALALQQFESAAALHPDNVEVLTNLGATLGSLTRYDEAEAALVGALRIAPDSQEVRATLGVLTFRRGMYAQAETELRAVCETDPDDWSSMYYRGEALDRLGRYDEAIVLFEQVVELNPSDARAHHALGRLYDRKHLPEQATAMYRRARDLQRP